MPEMFRVRLEESGHEVTVGVVRDGMTVLDKPATDAVGRPLRPKFHIDLRGKELDDALEAAGLSKSGTAQAKRERLAEYRATQASVATGGGEVTTTGGESATSEEDSK